MGSGAQDKESHDYDSGNEALGHVFEASGHITSSCKRCGLEARFHPAEDMRVVELYCPTCKVTRLVARSVSKPLCYCGTPLEAPKLTAGELNLSGLESLPHNMGFSDVDEMWEWAASQNPKPIRSHTNLRLIRGGGKAQEKRDKRLQTIQGGINNAGTVH